MWPDWFFNMGYFVHKYRLLSGPFCLNHQAPARYRKKSPQHARGFVFIDQRTIFGSWADVGYFRPEIPLSI